MPPDAPIPGLATDEELTAGRRVVECRDCHRPLTGREARTWGRGRTCRHKLGLDGSVRGPGRFDVEQETLPGA